jgi:DNA (cytosine-5)-methyltransferase 1
MTVRYASMTGSAVLAAQPRGSPRSPGVQPAHAANHWARAIESHAANFPDVDHWKGDIQDLDVRKAAA